MSTLKFRSDSLVAHVCAFFLANPDEELDRETIAIKWSVTESSVHTKLAQGIEAGVLVREANAQDELVYKRGPKLQGTAPTAPRLARLEQALRPSTSIATAEVDPAAVPIESDVPLPVKARGRKPVDWDQLLNRMKPGHSAVLPVSKRAKVGKACKIAKDEGRGSFVMQTAADKQTFRLWRMA